MKILSYCSKLFGTSLLSLTITTLSYGSETLSSKRVNTVDEFLLRKANVIKKIQIEHDEDENISPQIRSIEQIDYTNNLPNELWVMIINKLKGHERGMLAQTSYRYNAILQDPFFDLENYKFISNVYIRFNIRNLDEFTYRFARFIYQQKDISLIRPEFLNEKDELITPITLSNKDLRERLKIYYFFLSLYSKLKNEKLEKKKENIKSHIKIFDVQLPTNQESIQLSTNRGAVRLKEDLNNFNNAINFLILYKFRHSFFLKKVLQDQDSKSNYYSNKIFDELKLSFPSMEKVFETYKIIEDSFNEIINMISHEKKNSQQHENYPLKNLDPFQYFYQTAMMEFIESNIKHLDFAYNEIDNHLSSNFKSAFRLSAPVDAETKEQFKKALRDELNNHYWKLNNVYKQSLSILNLSEDQRVTIQIKRHNILEKIKKNINWENQDAVDIFHDSEQQIFKYYAFTEQTNQLHGLFLESYHVLFDDLIENDHYFMNPDESVHIQKYSSVVEDLSELIAKGCNPDARRPLFEKLDKVLGHLFEENNDKDDLGFGSNFYHDLFFILEDLEQDRETSFRNKPTHYFNVNLERSQKMFADTLCEQTQCGENFLMQSYLKKNEEEKN